MMKTKLKTMIGVLRLDMGKGNRVQPKSSVRKLLTLCLFAFAFLENGMAQSYEPKLEEVYDFTSVTGYTTTDQNGTYYLDNATTSSGSFSFNPWYYREWWRFALENVTTTNAWTIENGWGIKNNSGTNGTSGYRYFRIDNLHDGDLLHLKITSGEGNNVKPKLNGSSGLGIALGKDRDGKTNFYNTTITEPLAPSLNGEGDVILLEANHDLTQFERYFCVGDGSLIITCPNQSIVQEITITTWHKASYSITSSGGTHRFEFTGPGVHTDKHAAVPYMTMQFGSDNNLTYVEKYDGELGSTTKGSEGNTYVTFSGNVIGDDDSRLPNEGSYYYFYPEANGTLYIYGSLEQQGNNNNDMTFVVVNNTENGERAALVGSFTKSGNRAYYSVNVEKGKKYYVSSNPNNTASTRPIFHLQYYTFTPTLTGTYDGPLHAVVANGSGESSAITVSTTASHNLTSASVKRCLGNITSANVSVSNGTLVVSNVVYNSTVDSKTANKGGCVIVRMNPSGDNQDAIFVLTVAYKAEDYANQSTKQVKVWDFYNHVFEIGQYKDHPTGAESQLYKETTKTPPDWNFDYLNLHTNAEPVYKSVYDMEGDNADMLVETEGLIFETPTNVFVIYNENDINTGSFQDRFVGLLPGGKITIPDLKANDRVRILMGRYGAAGDASSVKAVLGITNGRDVSLESDGSEGRGKLIEDDYQIGGSTYRISGGNCVLYGDYNFIVDHDGDFSILAKEGKLLKFYRIEIYRSTNFVTTNGVLQVGSAYELLNPNGTTPMVYNLHNHGKGERIEVLRVDQNKMYTQDSSTCLEVNFTENSPGSATAVSYIPPAGSFGSYRVMLGNKTIDGTKYITDRAERTMAVGYRETKTYPYTWDFTDLSNYTGAIWSDYLVIDNNEEVDPKNPVEDDIVSDHRTWIMNNPYVYLREATKNENQEGHLFASGSQLYAHNHMFPETAGLGFKRNTSVSDVKSFNNSVQIKLNEGLLIRNSGETSYHKILVPQVDINAAVYVRATPDASGTIAKWSVADGTSGTDMTSFNVANSSDKIYVFKNNTSSKQDFDLWFNNIEIKKIAVSKDPKTVNKYGWATESRDHDIDPELTSYMTGQDFTTFLVTDVNYSTKKVTMTPIENNQLMPAATNDGDIQACIIHNNAGSAVSIIDGGFHLFVPDIHDQQGTEILTGMTSADWNKKTHITTTSSLLKAQLTNTNNVKSIPATSGDKTNYTFHYKYWNVDDDGVVISGQSQATEGPQAFYRIVSTGASSTGNQAYLQLDSKGKGQYTSPARCFNLSFGDDVEPDQDPTAVEPVLDVTAKENTYYNLKGQKFNGTPTRQGLYIVNGKKMYVK